MQLYGYFEARVRFTRNNGWWSAFWLFAESDCNPFVDGYEIDIFEDFYTRAKDPLGPRRNILSHTLHSHTGSLLKSWGRQSLIPGSLDDFYVIGCKWTPYRVSIYLNGKLVEMRKNKSEPYGNSPYATWDAVTHATGIRPMHAILSGHFMNPDWAEHDTTGVVFPEHYLVDYVRIYKFPDPPHKRPRVTLKGKTKGVFVPRDATVRLEVEAKPSVGTGKRIRAVRLFDSGHEIAVKTDPPYDFEIPLTPAFYRTTHYMNPGRSEETLPLEKSSFPHVFAAFAEDEAGSVSHSETVTYVAADYDHSTPYQGVAQEIPGTVDFCRYDEGGQNIAYYDTTEGNSVSKTFRPGESVDAREEKVHWTIAGEWLTCTVDIEKSGLYSATLRYGSPDRWTSSMVLLCDGCRIGAFACKGHENREWEVDSRTTTRNIWLPSGRHRLTVLCEGRCSFKDIRFKREGD